MPERRGVWKPRASKYFFCSFTVGDTQFRGSTKSTRYSEALAFAEAWRRAEFTRSKGGGSPPNASEAAPHGGGGRSAS